MGFPACILSKDDIITIWESTESVNELAQTFGISLETLIRIKDGSLYRNITKDLISGFQTVRGAPPKLTQSQAISIINSDLPISVLARKFNVKRGVITDLRNGKTWKQLSYLPRKKSKHLRTSPTRKVEDTWVRFTDLQVLEIISQFPIKSNRDLAKIYNVSAATISAIRSGRHYKHLTGGVQQLRCVKSKKECHPATKLTEEQVREIKNMDSSINNGVLGRRYGVLSSTIWKIRHGVSWKDVK